MDTFNVEAAKQKMKDALDDYAINNVKQFCKHFTLIAAFAGWKWDKEAIDFDSVEYYFNSHIYTAKREIDKFVASDFSGKNLSMNVSSGRIVLNVIYYVKFNAVKVNITVDIG